MRSNRILPRINLILISWFFLGAVTILNLNGFMQMRFGLGNILSPVILLFSILIITMVPKSVKLGVFSTLKYYYYFMLFYIFYGAFIAYFKGIEFGYLYVLVKSHVSSIIVVTSAAYGFVYCATRVNSTSPLNYVYVLALGSLASIYYGRFDSSIYRYVRYEDLYQSRFSGFFANPNEAGMAACVVASFCLFFIAKRSRTTVNIGLLSLAGIAVFLTFSRSALIVYVILIITYVFFLLITKGNKILGYIIMLIAGLLVLSLVGIIQNTQNWDRTQQKRIDSIFAIVDSGEVTGKETERVNLLKIAGEMVAESPIIGHGLGAIHKMQKAHGLGSHNSFLVIQGETGILGAFLFVFFLLQIVRKTLVIKEVIVKRLVLSYLFVFLSMMFFTHNGLTNRNHNFYLGTMLAVISLSGNQRKFVKSNTNNDFFTFRSLS